MIKMKNIPGPEEHHEDVLRRLHKTLCKQSVYIIRTRRQAIAFLKRMYFLGNKVLVTDEMGFPMDREFLEHQIDTAGECKALVWLISRQHKSNTII